MTKKVRGRRVWLVTWEWSGDHAKHEQPIAAIFRPQLSGKRVREFVDLIHQQEYSPEEKLRAVLNANMNPYPADFSTIAGIPWHGEIFCGHNPWLRARIVDDFQIDDEGKPSWKERERPKPLH